jgi:hypothetical protein
MKTYHLPHFKQSAIALPTALIMLTLTSFLGGSPFTPPAFAQDVQPQPATTETSLESQGLTANSLTLTASPPRVGDNGELKGKPGETLQTTLKIRNASEQTLSVTSIAQDFIIGEDGATPVAITDQVSNRWSLASWITLGTKSQVLRPQQNGSVSVVITIPPDALPGGHYAMVVHEPSSDLSSGLDASASRVAQRVGSLLYVVVDGPINESAFIRNFEFPQMSEFGPVPFSFTVENMSDVHIKPQMSMNIYNFFNQKVDTLEIESKNIFPYTPRSFQGQWNRVWGIGKYRAELVMSYGSNGSLVVSNTTFWLIPLKLVLAGVVVLLVLIALIIVIKRHLDHRNSSEKKRIAELEDQVRQLSNRSSDVTQTAPPHSDVQS